VEYEQRTYDAPGDWKNEVLPSIRDLRSVLTRCANLIE
jgi:hypothetical protein